METLAPIAEGLFVTEPEPRLVGGQDRATGRIVFPCPADEARFERVLLPDKGRIWSWTVQRFPPKSPPWAAEEPFRPFALAYVELPGAVIVESRLIGFDFGALKVGAPCRLVLEPFGGRLTFAFAPLGEPE